MGIFDKAKDAISGQGNRRGRCREGGDLVDEKTGGNTPSMSKVQDMAKDSSAR